MSNYISVLDDDYDKSGDRIWYQEKGRINMLIKSYTLVVQLCLLWCEE